MKVRFAGIEERLKRADENITNLNTEITLFFKTCEYPIFPKINTQEHTKALQYFKNMSIPLRFSILAGEIIHHLRSCMDHIIWELSDDATRQSKDGRYLEFPMLEARPTPKNKFTSYDRKIKGVTHIGALKLICEFQPYKHPPVTSYPLWIVHNMDIVDKHKELVITHPTGYMEGPWDVMKDISAHLMRKTRMSPQLSREFDKYGKVTPQISFRDLPGREVQPIVPALTQLSDYVRFVIGKFDNLIS